MQIRGIKIKRPLIVGIDPGTITGYAVLDLNGEIIEVKSSSKLSLKELIKRISSLGTPIIVSCDVVPAPKIVSKFASKFESKLIVPDENLTIEQKRRIISKFKMKIRDKHKRDSLAAAQYAFSKYRNLFEKIRNLLSKKGKLEMFNELIRIVVVKDRNIKKMI